MKLSHLFAPIFAFSMFCLLEPRLSFASPFPKPEITLPELTVVTLNLHGYHPMGEAQRIAEDRAGNRSIASTDNYFFTLDELERGQNRQLETLSQQFSELNVDVIFLQEVGAGLPTSPKDCNEFRNQNVADRLGKNTAVRLRDRLQQKGQLFEVALACRGNHGWITREQTFKDQKILKSTKNGDQTVFDFRANPYPNGMIVEGLALLVRAPWKILENQEWNLSIPGTSEKFYLQVARISRSQARNYPWFLVANIHGGHKLRHFEQAVQVRRAISEWIENHHEKSSFAGALIGGDMNAILYRPSRRSGEIGTVPWEIKIDQEFDYGANVSPETMRSLRQHLENLNFDSIYKPWANITDLKEARSRIDQALAEYTRFVQSPLATRFYFQESLSDLVRRDQCQLPPIPEIHSGCEREERIDAIYASDVLKPQNGFLIFQHNSFQSTAGPSDHPGLLIRYHLKAARLQNPSIFK